MTLYMWKVLETEPPHYQLSKWEDPQSERPSDVYEIRRNWCDCPAHVAFCKHLAMAKELRESGRIKSGLIFDDRTNTYTTWPWMKGVVDAE